MRERDDAAARIERDALSFLVRAVDDFRRDNSAWLALLEDLNVPLGLDDPEDYAYATFSHAYSIEVTTKGLVLSLSRNLPRQLEATWVALTTQPWCFCPRLHEGSIEMQVRGLAPAHAVRVESTVSSQARVVCDAIRRGVEKLVSIAAPSPLPHVTAALDNAIRNVEAIASAKVERIRAASDAS